MSFDSVYNLFTQKILPMAILILISSYFYSNLYNPTFHALQENSSESEIEMPEKSTSTQEVLSTRGRLNVNGYTKNPSRLNLTPDYIRSTTSILKELNQFRYKRWEKYTFTSKYITFSIMVFDYMYAGGFNIFFSDIRSEDQLVKRYSMTSFMEKPSMADNCNEKCYSVKYSPSEGSALSKAEFYKFHKNQHKVKFFFSDKGLVLDLELTVSAVKKDSDGFGTVAPINNDSSLFYSHSTNNLLTVKGKINVNKKALQPNVFHVSYSSIAGVFPLRAKWFSITANGITNDKKRLGLHFGYGLANPVVSKSTESGFYVNGVFYKLSNTEIDIKPSFEYSYIDEQQEQIIIKTTGENSCEVRFRPVRKLIDTQRFYYLVFFKTNISHGVFTGTCKEKNGTQWEFDKVYGSVELSNNLF